LGGTVVATSAHDKVRDVAGRSAIFSLGWAPLVWYSLFLLGPLLLVLATSFATRGIYGGIEWSLTTENFRRAFDPLYVQVFFRSLWLATLTGVLCFAIGFPMALTMATSGNKVRNLFVLLLAVPFLTNLIIRICALKALTATDGPLEQALSTFRIPHDPFALSQNMPLVMFGMISTYLPFMVFPLYGALERFDFSLVEAAQDLGATYYQVLTRVLLPGLRRAIASAVLLVFIPALGEFVIPDLLGGARTMLSGNLISEQFLKSRDWPFGSALSVILIALLSVAIFVITRVGGKEPVND
jgi:spermidine/putrescine transport system permease protein